MKILVWMNSRVNNLTKSSNLRFSNRISLKQIKWLRIYFIQILNYCHGLNQNLTRWQNQRRNALKLQQKYSVGINFRILCSSLFSFEKMNIFILNIYFLQIQSYSSSPRRRTPEKCIKLHYLQFNIYNNANAIKYLQILKTKIMPLQVSAQIFKWLQSLSMVKEGKRINDLLELSQQISDKFYEGLYIAVILRQTLKNVKDEENLKKLQALKQNSNPAIRLYNWNILLQVLKRLKIFIDNNEKSKIINYESEPIRKILKGLYQIRQKKNSSQDKALKVDVGQIQKKSLSQTINIMQFFILSISKHFKLSPQHTLNLFLDNNKYLSHLLVKGVKNNYQPIYKFLEDISQNIQYIIQSLFCVDQQENVNFFFNALKSCLISKDMNTCQICIDIWQKVFLQYKIKSLNLKYPKNWIQNQGINTLMFTLSRQFTLFQKIIELCFNYLEQDFFRFIQPQQKSLLWNSQKQKLNFFKQFITVSTSQVVTKFISSPLRTQWTKYIAKISKKIKQNDQIYILNAIFQNLWLQLGDKFEEDQNNLPNSYFQFLKIALNSTKIIVFFSSSISIFNLMIVLGNKKNVYAPFLFKTILNVFSSVNSSQTTKISFLAQNVCELLRSIKNLPGSPLIESLIKHLQSDVSLGLINIVKVLLQQKKLTEQQSIQVIQILTKLIFHDTQYSQIALQIVFSFIPTLPDQIADQYLQNNSKFSLAHFFSLAKNINKTMKEIKSQLQYEIKNNQKQKKKQVVFSQLKQIILCQSCVNFLHKYLEIDDIVLKNSLQNMLFHTYVKIKVQLKKKKIADLLLPVMKKYYQGEEDLENQIKDYEKQAYPDPQPKQSKINLKSLKLGKSLDLYSIQSQMKTIDPLSLKPSSFALRDLESLKQKKQQLKTIQLQKQKQFEEDQQKMKQIKNFLNQKRIIQFGSVGKPNFEYKNIYQFDSMKQQESVQGVPIVKLLNLQKQQQSTYEQDAVSVMKKYRKVWRFLFFKYSSFGIKKQQFKTQQKIHMSQIWKMLREYDIFNFLKKQESQLIIKLINDLSKRKNDPQNLLYSGFQQYIIQICNYGYTKMSYPHLPPGRQIVLFIDQLKKITKQKGGSIQLFQNPQDVYFQETDVIKQFNKRLSQNSQYILPQGYKKYKLSSLQYDYNFHPMLQKNISSSYIQIFQILSQILYEKIGINLMEPLTLKKQRILAKPVLFQNINQKIKDYKKGYLLPKTIELKEQKQIKTSVILKKQFHPHINFSLGIKLGLSAVSVKYKSLAEQVAYWMQDMLNAVGKQSLKVQNRATKKVQNQIIRKRRVQSIQKKQEKKIQIKQWKRRAQSVKTKLQTQRKIKQQINIKKKQNQLEEKQKKRQKQQKLLKKKLQTFQQMKRVMSQRKEEAKYKRLQQLQAKKQKRQEMKLKVDEYIEEQKKQLQEKQEQLKRIKEQKQQEEKQKQQNKKQFAKNLYLSNLKKQQQILEKGQEIKQEYEELWQSQQIQKQLQNNKKPLKYLFDLLLKHQKSKISSTNFDQIGLNTMHYFSIKFMIIPFMIEKNNLLKIFNYVIKQKQKKLLQQQNNQNQVETLKFQNKTKSPGLNFKNFQQALFLIVIKAKKLLNKIKQKRKKKEQKLKQFLNAQKSKQGNHFDVDDVSDSESDDSDSDDSDEDEKPPGLLDEYLFNVQDVDQQTLNQLFVFLKLPKDKLSIQQRYRQVIQSKNLKPKNILNKQLRKQMEDVKLQL